MSSWELIEQIKNVGAKHIVGCVTAYNEFGRGSEGEPFTELVRATLIAEFLSDLDLESSFYDFFVPELRSLICCPANSDVETVIVDAIVDSHVLYMSGIEVMERALGIHESCFEVLGDCDEAEETIPTVNNTL